MKKLLVLLLISALAVFVFVGCEGIIDGGGDGDGDGDGEVVEGVVVEVEDEVVVGGKTYVKSGTREITVTFPAPVEMAVAYITDCTGGVEKLSPSLTDTPIPLWSEDGLVWTGSGTFGKTDNGEANDCCSSYVLVEAGECEADVCVYYPVIVDSQPPYATIEICSSDCDCEGCDLTFTSTITEAPCDPDVLDCGDDCSGLAGWTIAIYDKYPFDVCCEIPCVEPIDSYSGTACPIDWTSGCLTKFACDVLNDGDVFVVVNLVDNVGNEVQYGAWIQIVDYDTCEKITIVPAAANKCLDTPENVFVKCKSTTPIAEFTAVEDYDYECVPLSD